MRISRRCTLAGVRFCSVEDAVAMRHSLMLHRWCFPTAD